MATNVIARSLGKLNLALLSDCFEKIQTDEVIITQERLEHIKSRHPEDFDYFSMYGKESIALPDIILKDEKNTATVFMIKFFYLFPMAYTSLNKIIYHCGNFVPFKKNSLISTLPLSPFPIKLLLLSNTFNG